MITFRHQLHITDIVPPYDFEPALTQYNIYPWIQEDGKLVRVLRLRSGGIVKAEIRSRGTRQQPELQVDIKSDHPLTEAEIEEVKETLSWSLHLDLDPSPFYGLCERDPVLQAAMGAYRGGRGKVYPTVFEAIIGVICAQNTVFKRLYSMMHNLAAAFGTPVEIDGQVYYAFPTPQDLASASEEDLRACKVGYRAKYIRGVAQALVEKGLDPECLKDMPPEEAKQLLLDLPGIGPYTANLVMSVGLRRSDTVHLDRYVREVMYTFYFQGQEVPDETIIDYARTHWPGYEGMAIGLLTTDTDLWAEELGAEFRLKSGARG